MTSTPDSTATTAARPPVARRRSHWFQGVAVLLGLMIALLGVEVLLAVTGLAEPPMSKRRLWNPAEPRVDYHCYASNPHGELAPLPDLSQDTWELATFSKQKLPLTRASDTPWCVEYRYSSRGMREREIEDQPSPQRLRIGVLGDSFTLGEGVPAERTLPAHLEKLFGDGCEVLNVGRSGLNTVQELGMAQAFVEQLHGQRIILVWVPNDIELSPELAQRENAIFDLMNYRDELALWHASKRWYGWSRLLRLAGLAHDMQRIHRETLAWYTDMYDPQQNAQNLARLQDALRGVSQLPGTQAVLVLYPLIEQLEGDYPLAPAHQRVAQLAQQVGLPVLDLQPGLSQALAGRPSSQFYVHPTDRHPNGQTHEAAAAIIQQWLREEVPGFLATKQPGEAAPGS